MKEVQSKLRLKMLSFKQDRTKGVSRDEISGIAFLNAWSVLHIVEVPVDELHADFCKALSTAGWIKFKQFWKLYGSDFTFVSFSFNLNEPFSQYEL